MELDWFWNIDNRCIVLLGVFAFDEPVFDLINNPACNVNLPDTANSVCMIALALGKIFSWKVWLAFSVFAVIAFFAYKAITNEYDFRFAFVNIKNSYFFYVLLSLFCFKVMQRYKKVNN